MIGANSPKFTGEVPREADSLLEELTAFGAPAEARERLAQWHAAGADMPMVFLRPNLTSEQIERTLGRVQPDARIASVARRSGRRTWNVDSRR